MKGYACILADMPHETAMESLKRLRAQSCERPIVFDTLRPELCTSLEQCILDRMTCEGGRKTGSLNIGGWKSGEDFFSWPDEAVQELRRSVISFVGGAQPVGWAMVNRAGSRHPRHQHRAALLFGVYYVSTGSFDVTTPTVFECPCDGRAPSYEVSVEPHPGRLVIARGETWHWVPSYAGKEPRVTIAFDIRR